MSKSGSTKRGNKNLHLRWMKTLMSMVRKKADLHILCSKDRMRVFIVKEKEPRWWRRQKKQWGRVTEDKIKQESHRHSLDGGHQWVVKVCSTVEMRFLWPTGYETVKSVHSLYYINSNKAWLLITEMGAFITWRLGLLGHNWKITVVFCLIQ